MLLKQIEYFKAIIEEGNFYDAAEKCFVSQSAISQQIKKLEEELGVQLLNRHNRTFSLTPAGEYFYRKCLIITNDIDKMIRETKRISNKEKKTLRIGYYIGYQSNELSEAIAEFSTKFPTIEVIVTTGSHDELYRALEEEMVDIVLNDQRRAFSNMFYNEILAESETYVIVSKQNSLNKLNSIEVSDLKNIPCVLLITQSAHQEEMDYYKDIIGVKSDFVFAKTIEEAKIKIITAQGFMPIDVIEKHSLDTTTNRIKLTRNGEAIKKNYCAFWRKNNSLDYVFDFANILKDKF